MLTELISAYNEAQRAWHAKFDEDDTQSNSCPEWGAYEVAENAVLYFPCESLEEVRAKASFVLADENAQDSLRNCYRMVEGKQEWCLTPFLHSLLGAATQGAADAELIQLAGQRARLVQERLPLVIERNRLWEVAKQGWLATGLSIDDEVTRWQRHLLEYGYLAAEDADNAVLDQLNVIDEKIRATPVFTFAGLAVKFLVVRDAMNLRDEGPRNEQDWHVLLFNQFADELCGLAGRVVPGYRTMDVEL